MPDPAGGAQLWRLVAVALLVAANGFFVAAEFALVASRRTRVEGLVRQGDRKAMVAKRAIQTLTRSLSATQLGITLRSLGLGWIGEPALADLFGRMFAGLPGSLPLLLSHGVAVTVAFVLITFLHVVLGELTPKALALLYPETLGRWLAPPLVAFAAATNPFIWILNNSAKSLLRLVGARPPSERERVHSPEEILMLVDQSRETGGLGAGDARLIEGVFEFSEKNAREVMTPRTQMVALPATLPLDQAADRVAAAGRSRYPVYQESLDDIVGTVHAKAILAGLRAGPGKPPGATVTDVMRPAFFVPGTREVEDVLADMKRQKVHLAIVLDEFRGPAGLGTMEDLLEEIVGQIYDEYDRPEPAPATAVAAPTATSVDTADISGQREIRDVNEIYRLNLDDGDYTTIGGLLFGTLGRLPRVGDRLPLPA